MKKVGYKNWSKIISEFTYGIEKIIKSKYNGRWITVQGDSIFSIFNYENNKDINNIFDCSFTINFFIKHLNKNINKLLLSTNKDSKNNKINLKVGIGLWFSKNNYITKVGIPNERDIIFIGEAINYASKLSKLGSREKNKTILTNEKLVSEIIKDKKYKYKFDNYKKKINNNILEYNIFDQKYDNYIKKNV